MLNKKMVSPFVIIGAVIAIVLCAVLLYMFLFTEYGPFASQQEREFWRDKTHDIAREFTVGMPKSQLKAILVKHEWTKVSEQEDGIRLWTPLELRATNWFITIKFDANGLSSVKYGTADNVSERPEGAPPNLP
jgi:hypothetical protein